MRHGKETDLGGTWRFRCDPENLGEHFAEQLDIAWQFDARWMNLGYDDGDWAGIKVPACWQAEGVDYNGVAWYRTAFDNPLHAVQDARLWLRFEGVDYFADVWLNEHYLGSHEGYFAAFQYEVTPCLQPGQNLLAVRVDSPSDICAKEKQTWQLKGLIKGALQRWDVNNPEVNPGGIWNDVKLIHTGPGAIQDMAVHSRIKRLPQQPGSDEAVPATVVVAVRVAGFPLSVQDSEPRLHVSITPLNFDGQSAQASQTIRLLPQGCAWHVPVELEQGRLWHTWDLGAPCLYTVRVSLEVDGVLSDEVSQTFGLRQIEQKQGWETYLNGLRIFQRGANYLSDQLLSTMTPERYERDVQLLRQANLNTVHPFCVVEKQSFYDACDRAGILVYQDFPMWLEMDTKSDLVRRATLQMHELVAQFGHHPSIFVWNCGSQASVANVHKLGAALERTAREADPTRIVHRSNALIDYTGTRTDPVGDFYWSEQHIADFQAKFDWRVDTHQYYGWYYTTFEDLTSVPLSYLQLVTEYGAQALPSREMLEQMMPQEALFPPVWPHYTRRCFQPEYQFRYIDRPTDLEQFITDSQAYQARFIQYHTEYYRRHKFDPCNGAHLFCFNDCWPAITWSVIDYDRQPKAGFFALQRAMAPLQVFLEWVNQLRPGAEITQRLWIVNDLPRSFHELTLAWKIVAEKSGVTACSGELACRVGANSIESIGHLNWTPDTRGPFDVTLDLSQDAETVAENRYRLFVCSEPE